MTKTLDLDSQVISFIKATVSLPTGIDFGRQDSSGPGVVYVIKPTNEVKRYYGGRVRRAYAFTIMTKLARPIDAIGLLSQIVDAVEHARSGDIKSANGSFQFVKAEMTDSPAYRSAVEDSGETYSVYGASFKTTIILNN
ncbi:hypothetical protein [Lacticaseibacillus parakribbianus]|uniref:hypothetical protein n=1 Tax=Lacticaseibacillus parakribbianus TaxID=2970927 RepID=UPI0021CB3A7E|nr:hypothetical protein [Lacticaseibacillus parakribbianus]